MKWGMSDKLYYLSSVVLKFRHSSTIAWSQTPISTTFICNTSIAVHPAQSDDHLLVSRDYLLSSALCWAGRGWPHLLHRTFSSFRNPHAGRDRVTGWQRGSCDDGWKSRQWLPCWSIDAPSMHNGCMHRLSAAGFGEQLRPGVKRTGEYN